jgi:uncharacterized protein (TIGR02594 family)
MEVENMKTVTDPRQIAAYKEAKMLVGLAEITGPNHNAEIVKFFLEVGHGWVKDDETAWCAALVGAMLKRAGLKGTGKLNARSYIEWGEAVDLKEARTGDIVVFWRGSKEGWQGHVGFYESHGAGKIMVLGGNQSDKISVAPYAASRLLGVRRLSSAAPVASFDLWTLILKFLKGLKR